MKTIRRRFSRFQIPDSKGEDIVPILGIGLPLASGINDGYNVIDQLLTKEVCYD